MPNYSNYRHCNWKTKIPMDDLYYEKSVALEIAMDLKYPNDILERIVQASSEVAITNAMTTARRRM